MLVELNCEDDRFSTVQALLLLIHWNDLPHAEKDASHWMRICLSLAISIGLHRNPDSSTLTLSQQKTWRRTWWSVHNHTRLTAEHLLSVLPTEEDLEERHLFKTPMITLDDFQLRIFPSEIRAVADNCEALCNIEYQKTQALVFIEKTKLCRLSRFSRISNRVRKLMHGEDRPDAELYSKKPPVPKEIEDIRQWLFQLPAATIHQCPREIIPTECERSIYLHQTWLRLLYLGSTYAACCDGFQATDDPLADSMTGPWSELAEQCLLDATDLFDEIDSLGLSEQLPCPSSALLALVLTYYRRSLRTDMQGEKPVNARSLHRCWNVTQKLKDTCELACHMIDAVEGAACADMWERLSSIHPSYS